MPGSPGGGFSQRGTPLIRTGGHIIVGGDSSGFPPPPGRVPDQLNTGGRELTPEIIKQTTAPGQIIGRLTGDPNKWIAYNVDRPTITWCPYAVDRALTINSALQQPIVQYNFGEIPNTLPGTNIVLCQNSSKGGTCFLSAPGRWWFRSIAQIDLFMVDAWHPGIAAKYFTDPGCDQVFQSSTTVPVSAATTQLWVAARGRIAGTVQLITGGPVRIALGQVANYLLGGTQGLILNGQGAAVTFTGDTFGTGALLAILNQSGGAGVQAVVETIEYINY